MCQITLSKSTEKVNFFLLFFTVVTAVTVVTVVRTIIQPLHKFFLQPLFIFFLQSHFFWKEQFDTFDNQCDVLRATFCNSRDVCVKRLSDFFLRGCVGFFCGEVA